MRPQWPRCEEKSMKTAVVYVSVHHGNTKKVAQAMAEELEAILFDLTEEKNPDLSGYELVGFASGVFYHGLHETMKSYLENLSLPQGQKFFLAATCGVAYMDYTRGTKKLLEGKGGQCVGSFQCRGFDTFGPFGKIGGIAKGRPNGKDLEKARTFARKVSAR